MQNAYASSIMVLLLEMMLFRHLRHAVKGDESKQRDLFGGKCGQKTSSEVYKEEVT